MKKNIKIFIIVALIVVLPSIIFSSNSEESKLKDIEIWDDLSVKRMRDLHPTIKKDAENFIKDLQSQGINVRVTSTYRSISEQNYLYEQGRTRTGDIVTNARGGESYHNFGLALDLVEIKFGSALWENPNWNRIGKVGKKWGFEWGGDWKGFKDRPHFQKTFGYSTFELQQMGGKYPEL